MLRTRLWMGTILILLTTGALLGDQHWPVSPFLFALAMSLSIGGCYELLHMLREEARPRAWFCYPALVIVLAINWLPVVWPGEDPWAWLTTALTVVFLASFAVEMAYFRVPGQTVVRVAQTLFVVAYLGLLPSFLIQLRRPGTPLSEGEVERSTIALMLAIFVPKCCDIGAYFVGRFLGRHKMSPILSPGKTWEGAIGGILAAVLATIGIGRLQSTVTAGWSAAALGLALGTAGIVGDLAESLIKRDHAKKDASTVLPGFGGVLDVVDSILFAAPVAYWWLGRQSLEAAV